MTLDNWVQIIKISIPFFSPIVLILLGLDYYKCFEHRKHKKIEMETRVKGLLREKEILQNQERENIQHEKDQAELDNANYLTTRQACSIGPREREDIEEDELFIKERALTQNNTISQIGFLYSQKYNQIDLEIEEIERKIAVQPKLDKLVEHLFFRKQNSLSKKGKGKPGI